MSIPRLCSLICSPYLNRFIYLSYGAMQGTVPEVLDLQCCAASALDFSRRHVHKKSDPLPGRFLYLIIILYSEISSRFPAGFTAEISRMVLTEDATRAMPVMSDTTEFIVRTFVQIMMSPATIISTGMT